MILDTPANRVPGSQVTGIRFTLEQPPFAGQAFDVVLHACANPVCPCGSGKKYKKCCGV